MIHRPPAFISVLILAFSLVPSAFATNGMNMEGYGPIALGMGGASFAYDNGTAASINNPATLGLGQEGLRTDIAFGFLGPDIESSAGGESWKSDADAFYMPALGINRKKGGISYGLGIFAQGGMGTDYDTGPGAAVSANLMQGGNTATGAGNPSAGAISSVAGLRERAEIGVGRLMVPATYEVNDKLIIGGTVDYVWATMDLQMAMSGMQMFDMMGTGLINGSMVGALQGAMAGGAINDLYYGYFDFANNNDFTGEANSTGFAGKIGLTYKVNSKLSLGATYHSKVNLDKFEGSAKVNMSVSGDTGYLGGGPLSGAFTNATFRLKGDISLKDFSWPSVFGVGVAYQASDKWFVAADVKRIGWAGVMESFRMSFKANNSPENGAFAGLVLNADMPQEWNDQTVIQGGASYRAGMKLTLRAGFNYADNPVPDSTVLYLFPATVKTHFTGGLGYEMDDRRQVNFAMSYVPEEKVTNSVSGMEIAHRQFNWQIMYTHLL